MTDYRDYGSTDQWWEHLYFTVSCYVSPFFKVEKNYFGYFFGGEGGFNTLKTFEVEHFSNNIIVNFLRLWVTSSIHSSPFTCDFPLELLSYLSYFES